MVTYREICRASCSSLSKSHPSSLGLQPAAQIPLLTTISPLDTMASPNSYLCDTLPQAKLAQTIPTPRSPPSHGPAHTSAASQSERPSTSDELIMDPPEDVHPTPAPPPRKLCPRHKRMADEGTSLKLQQVRGCQIANVCMIFTHIPSGFGCSPSAGTGGHQYRLGELLRLAPSPASLDSPRSTDNVLLLSAISPRRPTLLHYPDRPLHRSPP